MGKDILAPGVLLGHDSRFWTTAWRWAGSLVARHQYLPGVEESGGTYRAVWQPLITGSDIQLAAHLAEAMPAVCRALTSEAVAPPALPARAVLLEFLHQAVDHLVRLGPTAPGEPERRGRSPSLKKNFDSVHDQWLQALGAPTGVMVGDPGELAQLQVEVEKWRRPLAVTSAAPFRLCFRLEEPEPLAGESEGETWFVRYLLQAADDQSLLLPVPDAWEGKGQAGAWLHRGNGSAREYLLVSLAQSARICRAIEASLQSSLPSGHTLNTPGAQDFLNAEALLLEQAGFGVMLPSWWTGRGRVPVAVRAHVKSPKMQGGAGINLDQILSFDWQVALGEEVLSLDELRELANLKASLVKLRGQWVHVEAGEIAGALAFWQKKAAAGISARELLQMSLGGGPDSTGLAPAEVTAEGWLGDLLARLTGQASLEELPAPDNFQGSLRPYQAKGYAWLYFLRQWGLGACLADDMGLGKTIQALALIAREWQEHRPAPVLLVCPTSVVGNWEKEAARFTPQLPLMVHHGAGRSRGKSFVKKVANQALVISSYALLHRDVELFQDIPWSGLILDEAQNIKNPETKQAKAARSLQAQYRLALTGTPVENNVGDLWSIMEYLNPGFLGTQAQFKRTFFIPIQANRNPEAALGLQRLTGPFILRRLKTDPTIITDLPEKQEMKVFCPLTKEQASLYAAVVNEVARTLEGVEGIQRKGAILGALSKLKQVCNHPAQFLNDNSLIPGRSGKLARLTEMLEEMLQVGDKALIFTQFAAMGTILQRYLQETFGREVLFLHGATPKKQRDQMVERFQSGDGRLPLFILSLKAGGTGLNLTAANQVFHFDRWWNPAVENQATDRAFRIGQTKNVQVRKFLCLGTLEEKIDEMIARKLEVAEEVVGTGEGWLTELSNASLKELMSLRREALGE